MQIKDITAVPLGLLQPLPVLDYHFYSWRIDFATDLPYLYGSKAILTYMDSFAKHTILISSKIPCKTLTADKTVKLFFINVVSCIRVP